MIPDLPPNTSDPIVIKPKINLEAMIRTKLPSLPESTMRILDLVRDVNVSTKKLTAAVECNPALSVRILRLANSPIYSVKQNITSIAQAIDLIGTKTLYDTVVIGMTADLFAKEIRSSVIGRTIWEHSLAVALLAREFSRMLGMRGTDEVFTCGLLHDIGKIILLRADVEIYSGILGIKEEEEMLTWERENFGYDHAELGALVAKGWRLSESVCQCILNHHNASHSIQTVFLAHLINIADIVANYNGFGLRLEEEAALLNSESALLLHLTQENLHNAWENVQHSLEEITNTFS